MMEQWGWGCGAISGKQKTGTMFRANKKSVFHNSLITNIPGFHYSIFRHDGAIWLTVTQSDHQGSTDRIMFGKLASIINEEL